jgi:hypothetical protein
MKANWGSAGIAPLALWPCSRWRWAVSFTPQPLYLQRKSPWYPLDRRPDGPQIRSRRGGEEKILNPRWESNPRTPIVQPVQHILCSILCTVFRSFRQCFLFELYWTWRTCFSHFPFILYKHVFEGEPFVKLTVLKIIWSRSLLGCDFFYCGRQHGPPKRRYPTTTLATRCHNPEDLDLKHYRRESLRSRIKIICLFHFV